MSSFISRRTVSSDWILNNLVSVYFDFAEIQALKHRPMYMEDYVRQLDNNIVSIGEIRDRVIKARQIQTDRFNSIKLPSSLGGAGVGSVSIIAHICFRGFGKYAAKVLNI